VINYKETPNWAEKAKELIPRGAGCEKRDSDWRTGYDGSESEAVQFDGIISIIGFVAQATEEQPGFLECLNKICTVRGIVVGSRDMFEDMVSMLHFPNWDRL
jgi:hypothetical protein